MQSDRRNFCLSDQTTATSQRTPTQDHHHAHRRSTASAPSSVAPNLPSPSLPRQIRPLPRFPRNSLPPHPVSLNRPEHLRTSHSHPFHRSKAKNATVPTPIQLPPLSTRQASHGSPPPPPCQKNQCSQRKEMWRRDGRVCSLGEVTSSPFPRRMEYRFARIPTSPMEPTRQMERILRRSPTSNQRLHHYPPFPHSSSPLIDSPGDSTRHRPPLRPSFRNPSTDPETHQLVDCGRNEIPISTTKRIQSANRQRRNC